MSSDSYEVLAGPARAEIRDRGSRFLALVVPVSDEGAAREKLAALEEEFRDATHVCWAWRLGTPPRERAADAGEPAGTAGPPILQALRTAELSDALVAVVRWYGGVNLGRGGLVRAYGAAARAALAAAPRRAQIPTLELTVETSLARAGAVKRLLRPPAIELVREDYSGPARLVLRVQMPQAAALRAALADLGARVSPDAA